MKDKMMICNRANDCGWADCADRTPHSQDYMCSDKCKILPDAKCIPIEPQPATCPDCGHPVNSHTYDGCGYEPAVFCKCLRTRNQAIQGKDYCTSEWREYNCLDKETCPTLSDGSICTHYRRTPADLQPEKHCTNPLLNRKDRVYACEGDCESCDYWQPKKLTVPICPDCGHPEHEAGECLHQLGEYVEYGKFGKRYCSCKRTPADIQPEKQALRLTVPTSAVTNIIVSQVDEQPTPTMPLIEQIYDNVLDPDGFYHDASVRQRDADMAWHNEQIKPMVEALKIARGHLDCGWIELAKKAIDAVLKGEGK